MKNKILFILVILVIIISSRSPVFAQLTSTYQKEAIYFKGNSYVKNNQTYPVGFMGAGLKKEMQVSPEAFTLFKKAQKQKRWEFILSTAGVAAAITALATLNNRNYDTPLQIGLLSGSMALTFAALPLSRASSNNVHKAVWIRNGDVLD